MRPLTPHVKPPMSITRDSELQLLLKGLVALEPSARAEERPALLRLQEELAALLAQQRQQRQESSPWWYALQMSELAPLDPHERQIGHMVQRVLNELELGLMLCDPKQDDLPIVYVNDAMCRISGYARHELYGHNPRILQGEHHQQAGLVLLREAMVRERPCKVVLQNARRDGSTFLAELRVTPLQHDDGSIYAWMGLIEDITARQQTAKALEEHQLLLSAVYEAADVGICVTDDQGRFIEVNRAYCELLATPREALLGQSFTVVLPPEQREHAQRYHDDFIQGAHEPPGEWRLKRLDGRPIDIHATAARLTFRDGRRFKVTTVTDITERKRQEHEQRERHAREADASRLESLGLIAGGVAHDLNNMFAGMLTNLGTLRALCPPGSERHEIVDDLESLTWRATEFVQTLLTSAGQRPVALQPVELRPLLQELWRLVQPSLPAGIALDIRPASAPVWVRGDAAQLRQVLMNLVLNAAEASLEQPGQPQVRVTCGLRPLPQDSALRDAITAGPIAAGLYAQLQIEDHGQGMTPELQRRIFEPFFSTKATGRGLGLAAVGGIVRAHHGALMLQSASGRGTTFTLLLPALVEEATPQDSRTSQPLHALVVDDDPLLAKAIERVLQGQGYEVTWAQSADIALPMIMRASHGFSLVVLDVVMPGLRGDELAHFLVQRTPALPVLLISGLRPQGLPEHPRLRFLPKPFNQAQLVEAVRDLIEREPRG